MLGYDVGAVDYLTKPVNPAVLRSKVNVFVDLFRKTRALAEMNEQLEAQESGARTPGRGTGRSAHPGRSRAGRGGSGATPPRIAFWRCSPTNCARRFRLSSTRSPCSRTDRLPAANARDPQHHPPQCAARSAADRRPARSRAHPQWQAAARVPADRCPRSAPGTPSKSASPKSPSTDCAWKPISRLSPAVLRADSARLQQIFWNLITNAVKFTPEGGAITLRTSNNGTDNSLRVEVADTGVGIEAPKLTRISMPSSKPPLEGPAGLGLGLAICKALTEFHGGIISARSAGTGHGATFAVSLPSAAALSPPPRPSRHRPARPPPGRCECSSWMTIRTRLPPWLGSSLAAVTKSGAPPASQLPSKRPEPSRSMCSSPTSGCPMAPAFSSSSHCVKHPRTKALRGLALSGFGMEEDVERSKRAGFSDHLTKPVDFALLHRRLSEIGAELRPIRTPQS